MGLKAVAVYLDNYAPAQPLSMGKELPTAEGCCAPPRATAPTADSVEGESRVEGMAAATTEPAAAVPP